MLPTSVSSGIIACRHDGKRGLNIDVADRLDPADHMENWDSWHKQAFDRSAEDRPLARAVERIGPGRGHQVAGSRWEAVRGGLHSAGNFVLEHADHRQVVLQPVVLVQQLVSDDLPRPF